MGTDLSNAQLAGAELFGADLTGASLGNVNLSGANLCASDLSGAYLSRANLSRAELMYSDLRGTTNLDLMKVREAHHWEKAFFDPEVLNALGLPSDHNDNLSEQMKNEIKLELEEDCLSK